ncbi:phosphoribosylamine--glycine ligase [Candidatus Saccharibacteria bacterium RIFCSPHIGHO2_12_FULL_41_12]|nr:MAG: phosphoribosylamine--glycine ligase [Candidatus Saccharibacteria bacterium RIFCSPHIGHO2_12_FULL_41_12]
MNRKILVIGGGGREHALIWKIAQSPSVNKIYAAPGNGGISELAENVAIGIKEVDKLVAFAKEKQIDLTVVGPDDALAVGVVDAFQKEDLRIFGPTKAAAQIEASKAFSKDLMKKNNIPTANYFNFTDIDEAKKYLKSCSYPTVVKASGLAAGKGVIICEDQTQAENALDEIMSDKIFGSSGDTVVIEDFLQGQEVSIHALSDGNKAVIFPTSQDHKQIFDEDKGPNTGGMGVIAPIDWVTDSNMQTIKTKIVQPVLDGLRNEDANFVGCLYPGLMIDGDKVNTVEFNARFGDPETEVYMRLLDSDIVEIFESCVDGNLDPEEVQWKSGYAVTVVLASGGYPGKYQTGLPISGIEEAEKLDNVIVFHAGTKKAGDQYLTAGGRVLNVTATGETLNEALATAYKAVDLIHFEGVHYRTDIGKRPS